MKELERAKEILRDGGHTAVLLKGDEVFVTDLRGVKPLVAWLKSGVDFSGYYGADKVVGRGAGFLYALLKVKALHANVVSRGAVEVLKAHNIAVEYDVLVDNIINREGTGICPFEEAVSDVSDADEAYKIVIKKMREMGISV